MTLMCGWLIASHISLLEVISLPWHNVTKTKRISIEMKVSVDVISDACPKRDAG